ncbi:hypothetical protein [Bradyrhizobium cytisi]|uniref:Core-binding (CB) domain-containing protein n=1 Tax=Bradyrhizobium cytisi TaxID=515489 RepID=A0A5S4X2Y9_9BRAD|nr:hypothetical protein [Bradyrhizobium cytisi]TYL86778.1 hypothetical protein FXB38_05830 [Bradyrhizobium cytisi]
MSAPNTSQSDLIAFLDYLADKGLMNATTASSRKGAVKTLFSVLDPTETADVTTLKIDEVAMRFANKRGADFKPDSVKVYKSRVIGAIEDFKKYRADPLNFKVSLTPKATSGKGDKASPAKEPAQDTSNPQAHQPIEPFVSPSEIVFPIPIRPNTIVRIVGLPSDLTPQEASRIANVIQALASVQDPF